MQTMMYNLFRRLVARGLLTDGDLRAVLQDAQGSPRAVEELLLAWGIPKHELMLCLTGQYGLPCVEFDESVIANPQVLRRVDARRLKQALWFPLSVRGDRAEVVAWDPRDPALAVRIKALLTVRNVEFRTALPSDLRRIIEHNLDLNPGYPAAGGRTPLAKVRTFLADRRSLLACTRTTLAQGRTGLAFLRTGVSFITGGLVLYRIFGIGPATLLQAPLILAGVVMAADGFRWYLPARKAAAGEPACGDGGPADGTTVLSATWTGDAPEFERSAPIAGAALQRAEWQGLSPVMRRRFLASDRTDYAEERTLLAGLRTRMARARTGLAFTRTGIAFIGLGAALLRLDPQRTAFWTAAWSALIALGLFELAEGILWYLPGRRAGRDGLETVVRANADPGIWRSLFPPEHLRPDAEHGRSCRLPVNASQAPGIWATTGLALERTVLAERRNVMARLRTVMARSRTGLAFIRTGLGISAVGAGLLAAFGTASPAWAVLYAALVLIGLGIIADGLYWHVPAERMRKELPYCFCDVEITVPDYGRPARSWHTAVFSHDDL